MSGISLRHSVRKGDFRLAVDTEIPASGITGVFGESGAGKTTLLRCIAGLESSHDDDAGPVHKRRIGYVFQRPQLFAHLSVRNNIEYGFRRNPDADANLDEILGLLELSPILDRPVSDLSGGEAQRVSIARVLAQSPRLVLMDEPMSGLDERRRGELLPYLDRLHAESAVPIIYVSHDIGEVCRLSDHLLVLDRGRVVAEGGLQETLTRIDLPQLGGRNAGAVIEARKLRYDSEYDLTLFGFPGGEIWVPGRESSAATRLRIAASDVSLTLAAAESSTILNILPATIESTATESPASVLIRLRLRDELLVARITRRSLEALNLQVGDRVFAQIKSVTVRR
jgi:molybdate transport system ATP-binding protein